MLPLAKIESGSAIEPSDSFPSFEPSDEAIPAMVPAQLHHFFEQTCDDFAENLALVCGDQRLTYAELEARANQLARYLMRQGVRPGDRIGLLVERSVATYVSLLAVLKSGAAFVPLDLSFPAERIAFIAEDAALRALITTSNFGPAVAAVGCQVLTLDSVAAAIAAEPITRPAIADYEDALCYIIYTSGTTGRPKGVAVNHSSICNFIAVCSPIYGISADDRVYQGMTLAFDFSIEEVWPAFRSGAAIVAGPTDHRRLGAGLTEFLIEQEITVLACVPTLLATVERDVPTLRTLLVGGEACPADLVKRWWRPDRRMLNTYGPTETSVTATWTELVPEKPVTIGRPLPTYTAYLLDEDLRLVPAGEAGEICIGGPGVAVGYVNRPDLTAEKFVSDTFADRPGGRLYRTGDLGVLTLDGEIEYLGRIDTQVKIRGYRIELAEIEAVLLEDDGVANAIVALVSGDGGVDELAAYVVPRGHTDFTELRQRLHTTLRSRLPVYMVPAYVEKLDAVPMLPSNKADRSRLPKPSGPRLAAGAGGDEVPPETPLERTIAAAFARVFGHEIHSVEADFFLDLGGHSLFAAMAVSDLRQNPELRHLGIADLYTYPTIRALAKRLEKHVAHTDATPHTGTLRHTNRRFWTGGFGQFILLYAALIPWSAPTALVILVFEMAELPLARLVGWIAALAVATPIVALVLPVLLKWMLLGRVKPGCYPLWGWFFCRWWVVRKLLQAAPLDMLSGSPLMSVYLRLLGGRVGRGCYLGTSRIDLPDLIDIGDGASIGYDVDLDPSHVADGWLHVAQVTVGSGAFIGTNAVVSGGGSVGRGARLVEQSLVAAGQMIPDGETWAGSPAQRADADPRFDAIAALEPPARWSPLLLAGFVGGLIFLVLLPSLLLVPGLFVIWGISGGDLWKGLLLTPVAGLLHVLATCGIVALGKRLALPSTQPGTYAFRSGFGLRKWFADRLMILHMTLANSMYSTLYLLPFLRLLGTRVGPRAEVSTVSHIDPDLLTLGQECFVADMAVVGAGRFFNGFVVMGKTEVGARSFVGNAALVPGDTRLGHDSLIGVLSVTPPRPVEPGSSWLGSPAIFLPRRQASARFDESRTYRPSKRLVACRLAIEYLRVTLPATLNFVAMFLLALAVIRLLVEDVSLALLFAAMPAIYLGSGAVVSLAVAVLKWMIVACYRPRVEPQWSHFVWRTELITGLYENVAVPWLFHWLAGTPLMAPALRLFGARVGRRTFMETTFLTEFDLVLVGDDAAVGGQASLQTHLFEDRVMKMSTVHVGAGCSVGSRAVVLYDTDLGPGAELDSLSLVMKGETLPAGSRWRGIPARLIQ